MPLTNALPHSVSNSKHAQIRQGRGRSTWSRRSSRPRLERLEQRTLLSVNMVTSNSDSGSGSLREVIADASAGDTIEFAESVTSPIVLTGGAITISENLTINGPAQTN